MANVVTRINITLPTDLVLELKKTVPSGYRSSVIAGALSEKIAEIKRKESLKKLKGVWEKAGGVSFKSAKELKTWRKSLWSTTEKRFAKQFSG